MKNRWIALWIVLLMLTGSSHAAIYHVDDNAPNDPAPYYSKGSDSHEDGSAEHPFDSIQKAINVAVDGDTIIVAPGRYLSPNPWEYDQIKFSGRNIRLIGSAPTDFSVIDQTVLCGVVIFDGTEDPNCLLQGFKIQNHAHGGILGNNTQARISHCIISGNGPCGATVVKDVQGRISNCLIVDNTTFADCGVLPVASGCAEFVNCTIANNLSGVALSTNAPIVRNCIIYGNQGAPTGGPVSRSAPLPPITYSLIEDYWTGSSSTSYANMDADPCFVRPGSWITVRTPSVRPTPDSGGTTLVYTDMMVLIEGDYHLQTEGWRWRPEPIHGSHWYFDTTTSPAVDAGDPLDGLGEEIERAPDDPEGRWGVNRAIDIGAYGGTSQASLSPTVGETPGIGALDLLDYWPFGVSARAGGLGASQWYMLDAQGIARRFYVTGMSGKFGAGAQYVAYHVSTANASDWVAKVNCYYGNRTLYITEGTPKINPPQAPEQVQAEYPEFLVPGTTIQAPYDPFTKAPVEYRSVLVVRGTLAEALADTSVDPAQFLVGEWPDVIALREIGADGTAGDPIAIFARGFGPLMIAGRPVTGAVIGSRTFGTTSGGGTGTRATR